MCVAVCIVCGFTLVMMYCVKCLQIHAVVPHSLNPVIWHLVTDNKVSGKKVAFRYVCLSTHIIQLVYQFLKYAACTYTISMQASHKAIITFCRWRSFPPGLPLFPFRHVIQLSSSFPFSPPVAPSPKSATGSGEKQASLFAKLINKDIISMNNMQGQAARKAHKAQHPGRQTHFGAFWAQLNTVVDCFCGFAGCSATVAEQHSASKQ